MKIKIPYKYISVICKQLNIYLILLLTSFLAIFYSFQTQSKNPCNCKKAELEKFIHTKDFSNWPKFADTLSTKGFYNLSYDNNRSLWYSEVETPDKSPFTTLWNDYAPNNYHASNLDFINYYKSKENVELAIQLGPNGDMWGYSILIIKKFDSCYLATSSLFVHARFISKSYSILSSEEYNKLIYLISIQKQQSIDSVKTLDYCGYFADNGNSKYFYVNFDKDQLWEIIYHDTVPSEYPHPDIKKQRKRPEILELWNYIDQEIKWTDTYNIK